jgi:hypothetical protein
VIESKDAPKATLLPGDEADEAVRERLSQLPWSIRQHLVVTSPFLVSIALEFDPYPRVIAVGYRKEFRRLLYMSRSIFTCSFIIYDLVFPL